MNSNSLIDLSNEEDSTPDDQTLIANALKEAEKEVKVKMEPGSEKASKKRKKDHTARKVKPKKARVGVKITIQSGKQKSTFHWEDSVRVKVCEDYIKITRETESDLEELIEDD